jgi:hypothetical protein
MAIESYPFESPVRVFIEYLDSDLEPIDPSTVKVKIRKPDGVLVEYQFGVGGDVAKDSIGAYSTVVTADQDGDWLYRWEATGPVAVIKEGIFSVHENVVVAA